LRDREAEFADAQGDLAKQALVQPHEAEPDAIGLDRLGLRSIW
jgi:hypothetical protein